MPREDAFQTECIAILGNANANRNLNLNNFELLFPTK